MTSTCVTTTTLDFITQFTNHPVPDWLSDALKVIEIAVDWDFGKLTEPRMILLLFVQHWPRSMQFRLDAWNPLDPNGCNCVCYTLLLIIMGECLGVHVGIEISPGHSRAYLSGTSFDVCEMLNAHPSPFALIDRHDQFNLVITKPAEIQTYILTQIAQHGKTPMQRGLAEGELLLQFFTSGKITNPNILEVIKPQLAPANVIQVIEAEIAHLGEKTAWNVLLDRMPYYNRILLELPRNTNITTTLVSLIQNSLQKADNDLYRYWLYSLSRSQHKAFLKAHDIFGKIRKRHQIALS